MKFALLIGISGIVGAIVAAQATSADSLLDKHTKQLQTANTLNVEYTVQNVGAGPIEYTLKLAKPAKFRLESPDETVVGDGTTVWTYKKVDNSYTQTPQADADLTKFLKRDAVLAWAGFFNKEPFKDATGLKVGASHTVKGKKVTDVSAMLPGKPGRDATFFIDEDMGVARGMDIKGAAGKETIVIAKELSLSADPAKDSDYAFTAPDGAKKVDPAAPGVTFAKASAIFQTNCTGCHGGGNPRSGLDLSSYAGVMKGGRGGVDVVAGDPDSSNIMKFLKASGKPIMPPSGPISDADIATISAWIKGGAVEK